MTAVSSGVQRTAEPSSDPGDFWDLAYRDGEHLEHWEPLETPAELVRLVESGLVGPGCTALDIGCGAGAEAIYLAGRGAGVIAVDRSRAALELARRRAEAVEVAVDLRLGDAVRLPIRDREIDLAIDRGCLHTISRRQRGRYAREIQRVLRPGGALLLRGARADDEELGLVGISRSEIEQRFGQRGFRISSFEPMVLRARSGDLAAWSILLSKGVVEHCMIRPTGR